MACELALEAGSPTGDYVLTALNRLKPQRQVTEVPTPAGLKMFSALIQAEIGGFRFGVLLTAIARRGEKGSMIEHAARGENPKDATLLPGLAASTLATFCFHLGVQRREMRELASRDAVCRRPHLQEVDFEMKVARQNAPKVASKPLRSND